MAKAYSSADSRTCRLIPVPPGCSDSVEDAMPLDEFTSVPIPGTCKEFEEIDKVPMKFLRLGPDSRRLVLAFYRAILERFWIMNAFGASPVRPSTADFGRNESFFTSLKSADDRESIGAGSMRRMFGGVFRSAFTGVVRALYCTPAETRYGMTFFPPTPGGLPSLFAASGSPARYVPAWNVCAMRAWAINAAHCIMLDMTQRRSDRILADPRCLDASYTIARRPLYCAFVRDILGLVTDSSDREQITESLESHLGDGLCATREPFGCFVCRWEDDGHDMVPFIYEYDSSRRKRLAAGPRFNLWALALAMRALLVWRTQSVRFTPEVSIPHTQLVATRSVRFSAADSGNPSEERSVSRTTCYSSTPTAYVETSYTSASSSMGRTEWVDFSSWVPPSAPSTCGTCGTCGTPSETVCSVCYIISASEWDDWPHWTDSAQPDTVEAKAVLTARWPCVDYEHPENFVQFGGAYYPARWAVEEGDVRKAVIQFAVQIHRPNQDYPDGDVAIASESLCGGRSDLWFCGDWMRGAAAPMVKTLLGEVVRFTNESVAENGDALKAHAHIPIGDGQALSAIGVRDVQVAESEESISSVSRVRARCGGRVLEQELGDNWVPVTESEDPGAGTFGRWVRVAENRKTRSFDYRGVCSGIFGWSSGECLLQFGGFYGHFEFKHSAVLPV